MYDVRVVLAVWNSAFAEYLEFVIPINGGEDQHFEDYDSLEKSFEKKVC